MSESMSAASNEKLDFSSDGQQPEEKLWQITKAERAIVEGGEQLQVEFSAEDESFSRKETYWLSHEDVIGKNWDKTVSISRAAVKRLARAATGEPIFAPSDLVGKKVLATIAEDSNGYVRVKNFKSAPAEEAVS